MPLGTLLVNNRIGPNPGKASSLSEPEFYLSLAIVYARSFHTSLLVLRLFENAYRTSRIDSTWPIKLM